MNTVYVNAKYICSQSYFIVCITRYQQPTFKAHFDATDFI